MYEKVLKGITVLIVLLTIGVCAAFVYLPGIHERAVLAAELEKKLEANGQPNEQIKKVDVSVDIVEEEELGGQLKLEMPEGMNQRDVSIVNDYVTQTVFISFKSDVNDYFSEFNISGSSDHIASLSYYNQGENGVIELGLDRVYEIESDFLGESLFLDFVDPHDIYDKVVVIDAGHGSRASGAVKLKIEEKNIDLAIVKELKKLLDETDQNIGVYYTRLEDSNPTLNQRVQLANRSNADLFISVHNNSSHSGNFSSLSGTQVLYSESDTSELSSKLLATICLDNMVEELGSRKIGLYKGDDIYIIRTSEVPVALIEVGFMTNRDELEKLNSPEYQKQAAEGIYKAIFEAFEKGF